MSKRPKSRNAQRQASSKQKPKIAAAEAAASVKREDAPIALTPQTPALQTPAPVKPAPASLAPEPIPPTPLPPRVAAVAVPSLPPHLLENAVETMERSLKAAGQGTVAVNRKLMDFARVNLSSSLDLARSLACATNPMQIVHLQVTYWDERMKALASQAEELRALSADIVAQANEPIREHMRRSLKAGAA